MGLARLTRLLIFLSFLPRLLPFFLFFSFSFFLWVFLYFSFSVFLPSIYFLLLLHTLLFSICLNCCSCLFVSHVFNFVLNSLYFCSDNTLDFFIIYFILFSMFQFFIDSIVLNLVPKVHTLFPPIVVIRFMDAKRSFQLAIISNMGWPLDTSALRPSSPPSGPMTQSPIQSYNKR
jgi:hypothetical protein